MIIRPEITLDFVTEDGSLDEAIQEQIINAIVAQLADRLYGTVQEQLSQQVGARLNERIDELLDDFMNQPVIQTDRWGDRQAEYESVREMLKTQFDAFMTQPVDRDGKPIGHGCGHSTQTRVDWLVNKDIVRLFSTLQESMYRQFEAEIQKTKNAAAKEALSKTILKEIGVDKILGQLSKNE